MDLERELRINGEVPFDGADTLTFTRLWHDGGEVRQDSQGNDIRPTQVEVFGEQTACCRDSMGYITEPYRFYFEAGGKHRHPDCDQRADAPDRAFAHRPRKNAGLRRLCRRAATGEQRSC